MRSVERTSWAEVRSGDWKTGGKRRATAFAFGAHRPAMQLDQLLGNRKSQSRWPVGPTRKAVLLRKRAKRCGRKSTGIRMSKVPCALCALDDAPAHRGQMHNWVRPTTCT